MSARLERCHAILLPQVGEGSRVIAPPARKRASRNAGFTLIEVLVAFTVMATILVVAYRSVVTLRQGAEAFDDHTGREIVARAVLDEALADRGLAPGIHHGTRDGRRWTIVAKPVDLSAQLPPPAETAQAKPGEPPAPASSSAPPVAPIVKPPEKPEWATQRLTVRIESRGKPLEIETIRLVKAEP